MEVCCGTYSYCRGSKGNKPVNNLTPMQALERIAASSAGFANVYMGGGEIADLIGAPFGSAEVDMARLADARRRAEAMGLRIQATLVGSRVEPFAEAVAEGKRRIEQAAALGLRIIVDFGPTGEGSEEDVLRKYVILMRQLAPHAESFGVGISMKPHGTLLTNKSLIEIHKAVGHPAFGICMDPGNILYYTKGKSLPTDGLEELAPCVSCVVMKDCVLNPDSPQEEECERRILASARDSTQCCCVYNTGCYIVLTVRMC